MAYDLGDHSTPLRHGPVMANVMPGLWRFANIQFPFLGSKQAPAHSEPVKSPEKPFVPDRTTLFSANLKISPSGLSPWRYSLPLPSAQRTSPPKGSRRRCRAR